MCAEWTNRFEKEYGGGLIGQNKIKFSEEGNEYNKAFVLSV